MEKALLRRLIYNTSPTSDKKTKIFQKMLNKDEAINAFISVEIEMDATIEFTKTWWCIIVAFNLISHIN